VLGNNCSLHLHFDYIQRVAHLWCPTTSLHRQPLGCDPHGEFCTAYPHLYRQGPSSLRGQVKLRLAGYRYLSVVKMLQPTSPASPSCTTPAPHRSMTDTSERNASQLSTIGKHFSAVTRATAQTIQRTVPPPGGQRFPVVFTPTCRCLGNRNSRVVQHIYRMAGRYYSGMYTSELRTICLGNADISRPVKWHLTCASDTVYLDEVP